MKVKQFLTILLIFLWFYLLIRCILEKGKVKNGFQSNYKDVILKIGRKIRLARKMAAMTQEDIAKKLGLTKQSISHFENNRVNIQPETIAQIAKILKKDVSFFLNDDEILNEKSINNSFGRKLMLLRTEKNISRKQLSDFFKISSATIGHYETGFIEPSLARIQQIADYFKKPIDYFIDFKNEKKNIESVIPMSKLKYIPLFGEVRAGTPAAGDQPPIEGYMPLPHEITVGKSVTGAFKVSSDSMEPKIMKGMYVLISTEKIVANGDIALIHIVNDGTCIKTIKFVEDRIQLIPENKKYKPRDLKASEVHILGKVVGAVNFEI